MGFDEIRMWWSSLNADQKNDAMLGFAMAFMWGALIGVWTHVRAHPERYFG